MPASIAERQIDTWLRSDTREHVLLATRTGHASNKALLRPSTMQEGAVRSSKALWELRDKMARGHHVVLDA